MSGSLLSPSQAAAGLLPKSIDEGASDLEHDFADVDASLEESRTRESWFSSEGTARFLFVACLVVLFAFGAHHQVHLGRAATDAATTDDVDTFVASSSSTHDEAILPTIPSTFRDHESARCSRVMRAAAKIDDGEWLAGIRRLIIDLDPGFEQLMHSLIKQSTGPRREQRRRDFKDRVYRAAVRERRQVDFEFAAPPLADFFPAVPADFQEVIAREPIASSVAVKLKPNLSWKSEKEKLSSIREWADSEREFTSLAELCPAMESWAKRCKRPNFQGGIHHRIYHAQEHCGELEGRSHHFGGISANDALCDECDLKLYDFWPAIKDHTDKQRLFSEFSVIAGIGLQSACMQWSGMTSPWPLIGTITHKHKQPVPCESMNHTEVLQVRHHGQQWLQETISQRMHLLQNEHTSHELLDGEGDQLQPNDLHRRHGHMHSIEQLMEDSSRLALMSDDLLVSTRFPSSLRYWYNLRVMGLPRGPFSQVQERFGVSRFREFAEPLWKQVFDIDMDDPWLPVFGHSSQTVLDYRTLHEWAQWQTVYFFWFNRLLATMPKCPGSGMDPARCVGYYLEWSCPFFQAYLTDMTASGAIEEGRCEEDKIRHIDAVSIKQRGGKPFLPVPHFRNRLRLAYDVIECHLRPDDANSTTPLFDTKHLQR